MKSEITKKLSMDHLTSPRSSCLSILSSSSGNRIYICGNPILKRCSVTDLARNSKPDSLPGSEGGANGVEHRVDLAGHPVKYTSAKKGQSLAWHCMPPVASRSCNQFIRTQSQATTFSRSTCHLSPMNCFETCIQALETDRPTASAGLKPMIVKLAHD